MSPAVAALAMGPAVAAFPPISSVRAGHRSGGRR
ncbi:hypothetical protein HNR30_004026 [Nonomuraea soli]|uniref:Uncharacterized protein n=1 Tax=Nonomuraea soli TaxID=1032476 RepID=A0A7W0HRB5_9ACTN|nr:hypothetical protein [Nonomuraea soli]